MSFIQRKKLNKFCLSCLELKIETGRYFHLPENERLCEIHESCLKQAIQENEFHFLLFCPAYSDIRTSWLNKLELPENFQQSPVEEQVSTLINDITNVKATAQFIVDAYNLRSRILYLKNNR